MIGALAVRREVRKVFEAMTRQDVDAILAAGSDDAVFEFPTDTILGGVFVGKDAIRSWYETKHARMVETTFTIRHLSVENIASMGTSNVVLVEWGLDETDADGNDYRLSGVTSLEIEGRKARRIKTYVYEQDLLNEIWPARQSVEVG